MADEQTKTAEPVLQEFTLDDVAKHNSAEDCWMVIRDEGIRKVYDITKFLDDHPGGPEIILDLAGQDATDEFEDIGHSNDARAQLKDWQVGKIKGDVKQEKSASKGHSASSSATSKDKNGGSGVGLIVASIAIAAVALFFKYGQ